jgi:uncharacterized protein DUF1844
MATCYHSDFGRPPGRARIDAVADNAQEHEHDDTQVTFIGFVLSLAHTAAFHFGDVPDPATGKNGEANLGAAKQLIDILSLLEEKTRGNLSAEERQLLEQLVYELRMRFVEATKSAPPQEPSRIIIP